MRCLFTMFAEDMKLLPDRAFRGLLDDCKSDSSKFVPLLTDLWRSMNAGTFAPSIRTKVLEFNGNLFANAKVLPLDIEEIGELAAAAEKTWREVDPAIFGTLLEQALDPAERKRLGVVEPAWPSRASRRAVRADRKASRLTVRSPPSTMPNQ